jgi:hypothetical protein
VDEKDEECKTIFLAPDCAGGSDEQHGCSVSGPHKTHRCACGAKSDYLLTGQQQVM